MVKKEKGESYEDLAIEELTVQVVSYGAHHLCTELSFNWITVLIVA